MYKTLKQAFSELIETRKWYERKPPIKYPYKKESL